MAYLLYLLAGGRFSPFGPSVEFFFFFFTFFPGGEKGRADHCELLPAKEGFPILAVGAKTGVGAAAVGVANWVASWIGDGGVRGVCCSLASVPGEVFTATSGGFAGGVGVFDGGVGAGVAGEIGTGEGVCAVGVGVIGGDMGGENLGGTGEGGVLPFIFVCLGEVFPRGVTGGDVGGMSAEGLGAIPFSAVGVNGGEGDEGGVRAEWICGTCSSRPAPLA